MIEYVLNVYMDVKQMSKKISLYLDGTFNTPDSQTNVYKLFSHAKGYATGPDLKNLEDPTWKKVLKVVVDKITGYDINHAILDTEYKNLLSKKLIRYYDPGVGTRFLNRIRGGAFGKGVSENISQAYDFLCHAWEPGDEIYVFGFSRGAYTARSLVGLLNLVGLLDHKLSRDPQNRKIVMDYLHAYIKYLHQQTQFELQYETTKPIEPKKPKLLDDIPEWRKNTPVKLIGVWDTVGSLGIPNRFQNFFAGFTFNVHETLGNTEICSNVEYAYHAMAIDEHRVDFKVTPWTYSKTSTDLPSHLKDVQQLWFVGAHSNVGGGYKNNHLSDISCEWMQENAAVAGLEFSKQFIVNQKSLSSEVIDSYSEFAGGIHRIFHERFFRDIRFNAEATEGGVISEGLHPSVWNYFLNNITYQPDNIPDHIIALNTRVPANDPIA